MNSFNDKCLLCLSHNNNLKSVLSEDDDGIIVEEQLKFILSEENITFFYNTIVNFEPHRPKYICIDCLKELINLYKFKQKCFKSLKYLSKCVEKIKDNTTDEHSTKFREETIDKQVNNGIEKVTIRTEPEEEINLINLEEVVVKGEPEEYNEEIDTKNDPAVTNETHSENWLQNGTSDTASYSGMADEPQLGLALAGIVKNPQGKFVRKGQKIMAYNVYKQYFTSGENSKSQCVKLTARQVGISQSTVWKIVKEIEKEGTVKSPNKKRYRRTLYDDLDEDQKKTIRRIVHTFFKNNEPSTTDKVYQAITENETLPLLSRSSVWRVLKKLGFVFEKKGGSQILLPGQNMDQRRSHTSKSMEG